MKNVPNILSVLRIVLVPIFLFFVFASFCKYNLYIALVVFVVAAITDYLDGFIARKYNLVSNTGKFLDPIADKILMLSGLISLLYIQARFNALHPALIYVTFASVFIIIARDYVVDVIRQISSSQGHVIAADIYGKMKTAVQDVAVPMLLLYFALTINSSLVVTGFVEVFGYISYALFLLGVVLTVFSGINYFMKNREILK